MNLSAITTIKVRYRIAIVLFGYIAAFAVAWAVVSLYITTTNTPDRQTYQGMFAFGDMIVYLGALGLASLPASGAALFFLRSNRWFWIILSVIALIVTTTGIASAIAYSVRYEHSPSWLQTLLLMSPLRVLAAPLFGLAFLLSGLFAPTRIPRAILFAATVAEAVIFMVVAFQWFRALH